MSGCTGNPVCTLFSTYSYGRFTFPERPGALKKFLEHLQAVNKDTTSGSAWNLTLIHYRYTGGDVAGILIGIDVPAGHQAGEDLTAYWKGLGYTFVEETHNAVYEHFLR
jgi:threonine dehydratase